MINFSVKNVISFKGIKDVETLYKTCIIKKKSLPLKKEDKYCETEIYKTLQKDTFEKYEMRKDGKLIGDIEIEVNKDSVFVINLESYCRHKYKGIGTNLLQVAVERSMDKGNRGVVTLNADKLHKMQQNPKGFYEKMDFKELPAKTFDISIFGIPMSLDVNKSPFWLKRIK